MVQISQDLCWATWTRFKWDGLPHPYQPWGYHQWKLASLLIVCRRGGCSRYSDSKRCWVVLRHRLICVYVYSTVHVYCIYIYIILKRFDVCTQLCSIVLYSILCNFYHIISYHIMSCHIISYHIILLCYIVLSWDIWWYIVIYCERLWYIVICCDILYYVLSCILCCVVLCHVLLDSMILCYVVLYYLILWYIILCDMILYYAILC